MKKKMIRNIITGPMHYQIVKNEDGSTKIVAAKDIDLLNYKTLKSAYNPLYPDAGKVVKIPEDYLYNNSRHHLKDFIIVDGKTLANGNQVIIGFIGTSQINSKSKALSSSGNTNEMIAIVKVIVSKSRYKSLIKKSVALPSNKILTPVQLEEVKDQSKTEANINKSKAFRR